MRDVLRMEGKATHRGVAPPPLAFNMRDPPHEEADSESDTDEDVSEGGASAFSGALIFFAHLKQISGEDTQEIPSHVEVVTAEEQTFHFQPHSVNSLKTGWRLCTLAPSLELWTHSLSDSS